MKISAAGIGLIKHFEGCRLESYTDSVGVWTIGYGHTANAASGQTISQNTADAMLSNDLQIFEQAVAYACAVPLTQGQFDACTSFAFNLGIGAFKRSALLKLINEGNFGAAKLEFERWDMAGNKHIPGLLTRRNAEATMFGNALPLNPGIIPPALPSNLDTLPSNSSTLPSKPSPLTTIIKMITALFAK